MDHILFITQKALVPDSERLVLMLIKDVSFLSLFSCIFYNVVTCICLA
jgi:hypothetical protein